MPTRSRLDEREGVDETSERWTTAVHEAAHAVIAQACGATVSVCEIDARHDDRGLTRHSAKGPDWAVVAVAGERATRRLLGSGGGSAVDYQQASGALEGTGRDIGWAEHTADDLISAHRRDITALARQLYRTGHR